MVYWYAIVGLIVKSKNLFTHPDYIFIEYSQCICIHKDDLQLIIGGIKQICQGV